MKLLREWKENRAIKRMTIGRIEQEIAELCLKDSGEFITVPAADGKTMEITVAERVTTLMKERREIKYNGVDTGDVLKVAANVAIVAVIVGFEMSHIMNQKGSRFIKAL